jgi:hypothetical protein
MTCVLAVEKEKKEIKSRSLAPSALGMTCVLAYEKEKRKSG